MIIDYLKKYEKESVVVSLVFKYRVPVPNIAQSLLIFTFTSELTLPPKYDVPNLILVPVISLPLTYTTSKHWLYKSIYPLLGLLAQTKAAYVIPTIITIKIKEIFYKEV